MFPPQQHQISPLHHLPIQLSHQWSSLRSQRSSAAAAESSQKVVVFHTRNPESFNYSQGRRYRLIASKLQYSGCSHGTKRFTVTKMTWLLICRGTKREFRGRAFHIRLGDILPHAFATNFALSNATSFSASSWQRHWESDLTGTRRHCSHFH